MNQNNNEFTNKDLNWEQGVLCQNFVISYGRYFNDPCAEEKKTAFTALEKLGLNKSDKDELNDALEIFMGFWREYIDSCWILKDCFKKHGGGVLQFEHFRSLRVSYMERYHGEILDAYSILKYYKDQVTIWELRNKLLKYEEKYGKL